MKTAGIVAEYNPFHNGHAYMANALRKAGFEAVVCVMSGAFVQRGEAALLPTNVRAAAALAGGVDLVLRLPVPWAAASAEPFAMGGVSALAGLGCVDAICFGAETPDVARLAEVAAVFEAEAFKQALQTRLATGQSFAAARAAAAEAVLPGAGALLASPNNILGVEYCKALAALRTREGAVEKGGAGNPAPEEAGGDAGYGGVALPRAFALRRVGAVHDGPPEKGAPSAGWLRGRVFGARGVFDTQIALGPHGVSSVQGSMEVLAGYVPDACLALYRQAAADGRVLSQARYGLAMMARLRGKTAADFAKYPDAAGGLAARMAAAANEAVALEDVYTLAKTKRFAHARIRRLALAAALGLPPDVPAHTPFLQVLAANETGKRLLAKTKQARESGGGGGAETAGPLPPVGTSLAKLMKTSPQAALVGVAEAAAEDFYALCMETPWPGGGVFTAAARI